MEKIPIHTTVTSSLQTTARLLRCAPLVAQIVVPLEKLPEVAERLWHRYPSIGLHPREKHVLRRLRLPAMQMVLMKPGEQATILLLTNVPPDDRESWLHANDVDWPLTWQNYSVLMKDGKVTWRLSEKIRGHYRQRLRRLITGYVPPHRVNGLPYQLIPEVALPQVLTLANHLRFYPGLAGIRADIHTLQNYGTRLWRSTFGGYPEPAWPYVPYLPYKPPRTVSLEEFITQQERRDD